MSPAERAQLVRAIRTEIKQRRVFDADLERDVQRDMARRDAEQTPAQRQGDRRTVYESALRNRLASQTRAARPNAAFRVRRKPMPRLGARNLAAEDRKRNRVARASRENYEADIRREYDESRWR